jgi:hypothetical protein
VSGYGVPLARLNGSVSALALVLIVRVLLGGSLDGYVYVDARGRRPPRNPVWICIRRTAVRIGAVLVVIWVIVGFVAAGQRGYLGGSDSNCAKAGNTVITVIAGPLNYIGVNPKVKCDVPQPSK